MQYFDLNYCRWWWIMASLESHYQNQMAFWLQSNTITSTICSKQLTMNLTEGNNLQKIKPPVNIFRDLIKYLKNINTSQLTKYFILLLIFSKFFYFSTPLRRNFLDLAIFCTACVHRYWDFVWSQPGSTGTTGTYERYVMLMPSTPFGCMCLDFLL